jgi:hypothetical protein
LFHISRTPAIGCAIAEEIRREKTKKVVDTLAAAQRSFAFLRDEFRPCGCLTPTWMDKLSAPKILTNGTVKGGGDPIEILRFSGMEDLSQP